MSALSLTEIADYYMTDKGTRFFDHEGAGHLYTPHYEKILGHLKDEPVNLLEIGIAKGSSLLMWNHWFEKGKITGMDIDPSLVDRTRPIGVEGGGWDDNSKAYGKITVYDGDQTIYEDLMRLVRNTDYDIMVDDGSHLNPHQQFTFGCLFPHLVPGGYYILEDIHCNSAESESTAMVLSRWQATGEFRSKNIDPALYDTLSQDIESMTLYYQRNHTSRENSDDAFCIIKKRS